MAAIDDTPCPSSGCPRPALLDLGDDTTQIDFTTAFSTSFRDAKPRRRQTAIRKQSTAFEIYEEVQSISSKPCRISTTSGLIQRPPQRLGRKVNFVGAPKAEGQQGGNADSVHVASAGTQGQSAKKNVPNTRKSNDGLQSKQTGKTLITTRRNTLFIPADDTTMPSMHMGIFSPIKRLNNVIEQPDSGLDMTGIAAQMAVRRRPRTSLANNGPRRVPLSVASRVVQTTADNPDRPGQGGGKENLPPGYVAGQAQVTKCEKASKTTSSFSTSSKGIPGQEQNSTIKVSKRHTEPAKPAVPQLHPTTRQALNVSSSLKEQRHTSKQVIASQTSFRVTSTKPAVPSRFITPSIRVDPMSQQYPILSEDIGDVALYEDDWLSHQEVAITQLINSLFDSSNVADTKSWPSNETRNQLLKVHNDPNTIVMYKKLQVAITHGALSYVSDQADESLRIYQDLGRRKAFTDLWLSTYDSAYLRPALEVVIGRECSINEGNGTVATSERALRLFIEKFLLRNEDLRPSSTEHTTYLSATQRTLSRSLMLTKVLDSAGPKNKSSSRLLFLQKASYKCSSAVLQALMRQLNPAAGDPVRALALLGYEVSHVQYPLQEFDFTINNLAIDLRDGVRLVRLVELLLYSCASSTFHQSLDFDATTTILLPNGDLTAFDIQGELPLSQHLRLPCIGEATMLYNVQLALNALRGVKGMEKINGEIQADDIVNGHREKTVKLLWTLTSRWGLPNLLDWHDVIRETRKLRWLSQLPHDIGDDDLLEDDEQLSLGQCKALLIAWAKAVTAAHGVLLKNFTTSFSDGKAFSAIVNTYWPYLSDEAPKPGHRSLEDCLLKLGCNSQFAGLFRVDEYEVEQGHFFDRDFVLSALAFLCSRLLGPSRNARAATSIQRAWREHWQKVLAQRQAERRLLARSCAEAVYQKCQIKAARVIWRAWKAHKASSVHEALSSPQDDGVDIWLSL